MEKGYEWYKPKKHKKLLYELFRSNYISKYEIDKTIHMMNNGEFMYTIFGNPIINITLKDYKESSIKADFIYSSIKDIYNELKGDEEV